MIIYVEAAGCPFACRHCSVLGHRPYGALFSLEELYGLREEWGPLVIYYEPTAHPEFPRVVDPAIIGENGGFLVTTGFGLARRDDFAAVFAQLRAYGIENLSFTLHGLRDHHDWFVCRQGAFDDLLCASRRAMAAGFHVLWQVFLDRVNIDEIPSLVEMAHREIGEAPGIHIPYHRVSRRLWHYEQLRPSLRDIQGRQLDRLVDDPQKNFLAARPPEEFTAEVWLRTWQASPDSDRFRHPFEPRVWPPDASYEGLTLFMLRDRKVALDPFCGPRLPLGELSHGKSAILERVQTLAQPVHTQVDPAAVRLSHDEREQLHPGGASLRYKVISDRLFAADRGADISRPVGKIVWN